MVKTMIKRLCRRYPWLNFLGGKDGRNVKEDSYEGARVYHKLKPLWDGKEVDEDKLTPAEKESYKTYSAPKKNSGRSQPGRNGFHKNMMPKFQRGGILFCVKNWVKKNITGMT